ncbi:MAG: hypothetical protein E7227_01045 [Clostridiales bacterium]|nr:hypothetical protein [Clostridiales bacterium]
MALQIIRNNIINVEADAIVNTANPKVAVGRGVDLAIYEAAGREKLLAARAEIGEMTPGQAAYTPAFDLRAKYIIHTVGPAWRGGSFGERETVAACYRNSLRLAKHLDCESIAFPLIATGTYGFPKDEALRIAIAEISGFLLENEMEVMLVVYDKESFQVSGKLFSDIRMMIDDSEVEEFVASEAGRRRNLFHRLEKKAAPASGALPRRRDYADFGVGSVMIEPAEECEVEERASKIRSDKISPLYEMDDLMSDVDMDAKAETYRTFPTAQDSLDERLMHLDKTFQEYLFMLIDRKGLSDPDVYKKANIDRKHFSKIRSNVDYQPSKKTALALALALELNLDETNDLLLRAGLALSPSIMFDKIIRHCIQTKNYNIYDINCILFNYDQPTLGA